MPFHEALVGEELVIPRLSLPPIYRMLMFVYSTVGQPAGSGNFSLF
jgi:hypothetical protein